MGCVSGLKIDSGFATQGRIDDDALQVVVSLQKECSMLSQILSSDLLVGTLKARVEFGPTLAQRRDGAMELFFPSRMLASISCASAR